MDYRWEKQADLIWPNHGPTCPLLFSFGWKLCDRVSNQGDNHRILDILSGESVSGLGSSVGIGGHLRGPHQGVGVFSS